MASKKTIILLSGTTQTITNNTAAVDLSTVIGRAWVAHISTGTISGTTPTLDVVIQQSIDGTNWVVLSTFTQITLASQQELRYTTTPASDYLRPLLNYVRLAITVGGSATPTFNSVTVRLLIDPHS